MTTPGIREIRAVQGNGIKVDFGDEHISYGFGYKPIGIKYIYFLLGQLSVLDIEAFSEVMGAYDMEIVEHDFRPDRQGSWSTSNALYLLHDLYQLLDLKEVE